MEKEHAFGPGHQAVRLAALASSRVLIEGLTRCGRGRPLQIGGHAGDLQSLRGRLRPAAHVLA